MHTDEQQFNWLPTLALSAVISTIILIMAGSIVRVTGNALGCPDWPLCHGQAIPPILHQGAWVEFSHRLAALAAGSQIVLVLVFAWRYYRNDTWIYRPALMASILLVVQMVLGGIHVVIEITPVTGWIHTANAMLILGLMTGVLTGALIRNNWRLGVATVMGNRQFTLWVSIIASAIYLVILSGSYAVGGNVSLACTSTATCANTMTSVRNVAAMISVLCLVAALGNTLLAVPAMKCGAAELIRNQLFVNMVSWTTVATYLLLLTGSYVTRSGASLACLGFPLCGPAPSSIRALIHIQLLHRYTAYGVAALVLVIALWIAKSNSDQNARRFAHSLIILILLQIGLGAVNVILKLPMWSRALHLIVGASLWVTLVTLWVTVRMARSSTSRLLT